MAAAAETQRRTPLLHRLHRILNLGKEDEGKGKGAFEIDRWGTAGGSSTTCEVNTVNSTSFIIYSGDRCAAASHGSGSTVTLGTPCADKISACRNREIVDVQRQTDMISRSAITRERDLHTDKAIHNMKLH